MNPTEIQGHQVTVVGGARSGLAVARLLREAGASVFLTEKGPSTAGLAEALDEMGVAYEFGGHSPRALEADFVVTSPGVPSTAHLLERARRTGRPVYSEIEAASWFCRAPIVAVTGTNGKTTTTSLLGHIFRTAGRKTIVAGNIGYPFSDYVRQTIPDEVVALEVSSFQLDYIDTFRPRVAVLLNITPDHLDRYDHSFQRYAASKFRVFENQGAGDTLVYPGETDWIHDYVTRSAAEQGFAALPFRIDPLPSTEPSAGAFVRDDALVLRIHQQEEVLMQANELALRGRHNLYNSLAAAVAARVMEVRSDLVRESLTTFEGVPHRLEFVREVDGVRYINDSKATNVNAVWYALESFREKLILIAGGRDKGNDYSSLRPLVRRRARAVVAIGESAEKVHDELGAEAEHRVVAGSMEEALRYARLFAAPGDVVLLSPACSSFDMFENYEDRGDTFKRLVRSL